MHQVFEEFASDNQMFVKEFVQVFQKMIANGYHEGNAKKNDALTLSKWDWVKIRCNADFCMVQQWCSEN